MTRDQARRAQERVVRRLLANGWKIDEHLPALGKQHKTIGPRGQTTDMLDNGSGCRICDRCRRHYLADGDHAHPVLVLLAGRRGQPWPPHGAGDG